MGGKVPDPPLLPGNGLITVSELAAQLRKKPAAVRLLARSGAIAYYRVGRALLFASGDVEAFLSRSRRPARGERALRSAGL